MIAVDYRLSPEHRFPVPLDDCVDAVKWCVKFSKRLNLDPKKVTVRIAEATTHANFLQSSASLWATVQAEH